MLHILLLILKIIGIILGVLIGLILVSLCLALFVPVRYRIEARRTEGEGEPPVDVTTRLTWLLHFINVRLRYSEDLKLRVRILFFPVFRLPAKPKKVKKKKNNSGQKKKDAGVVTEKVTEDKQYESTADDGDSQVSVDEPVSDHQTQNEDETEQKLSIKDIIIKICGFFKNIWYTIKGICDRIKEIFENIEYYLDIIMGETFKSAFSLCKGELGSILSYIKPRRLEAELVIGTGDPASTAQILAYFYGILYPHIGNHVTVVGDFEQKRIEGSAFIKGKMRLFTFLKAILRIYFNKDIKELLKLFKKEDK